jgi:hypothetical protein
MVGIIHSILYVQQSSMTRQPNNSTGISPKVKLFYAWEVIECTLTITGPFKKQELSHKVTLFLGTNLIP